MAQAQPHTPKKSSTARKSKSTDKSPLKEPGWSHGRFFWNELMVHDLERAKSFYKQTLGWTFDPMPMAGGEGTYWIIKSSGNMVGGIFEMTDPGMQHLPEGWMGYIAVDDVDARVQLALTAGAQLMMPVFDIPEVGRTAILREPGGAPICWITPVM
ncbi:MAG: VOC family protein [Hyphomicrobiaceae bacterium]